MTRASAMFSCDEIVAATGGTVSGSRSLSVAGVSTDSRSIRADELFIPLKGERFDGHDYLPDVAGKGVRLALVENSMAGFSKDIPGLELIRVGDTLKALGDLAGYHRRRFSLTVAGVTGSNGKTTVKEMLSSILSLKGEGVKTEGNLNNLIGLPHMIFKISEDHIWGVFEMGMSEPGEIDRLAEISSPRVGIVTNVFPAHLESMGSLEAIARAKGELLLRLAPGGTAVVNNDDPNVSALPVPEGVRRISFGIHGGDVTATHIENLGHGGQRFQINLPGGLKCYVNLKAYGLHNVMNSLAAAAAALAAGSNPQEITKGLEKFRPVDKRFSLEELGGITLIDDSYNANPGSMAAGLVTLSELKGDGRAIAVLGDMLELGHGAIDSHLGVGRLAATCTCRLYLMGRFAETVKAGAIEAGMPEEYIVVGDDPEQLLIDLRGTLQKGDCVLVKGSRGMRMERVSEGVRGWCAGTQSKGEI